MNTEKENVTPATEEYLALKAGFDLKLAFRQEAGMDHGQEHKDWLENQVEELDKAFKKTLSHD